MKNEKTRFFPPNAGRALREELFHYFLNRIFFHAREKNGLPVNACDKIAKLLGSQYELITLPTRQMKSQKSFAAQEELIAQARLLGKKNDSDVISAIIKGVHSEIRAVFNDISAEFAPLIGEKWVEGSHNLPNPQKQVYLAVESLFNTFTGLAMFLELK